METSEKDLTAQNNIGPAVIDWVHHDSQTGVDGINSGDYPDDSTVTVPYNPLGDDANAEVVMKTLNNVVTDERLELDPESYRRLVSGGEETSEEWARFVMNNRNRDFDDYSNPLSNHDSKYDIVIGPVADDNMAMLFRQYEEEIIDFDTLLKGMIYKKTSSQFSFHTPAAVSLLRMAII